MLNRVDLFLKQQFMTKEEVASELDVSEKTVERLSEKYSDILKKLIINHRVFFDKDDVAILKKKYNHKPKAGLYSIIIFTALIAQSHGMTKEDKEFLLNFDKGLYYNQNNKEEIEQYYISYRGNKGNAKMNGWNFKGTSFSFGVGTISPIDKWGEWKSEVNFGAANYKVSKVVTHQSKAIVPIDYQFGTEYLPNVKIMKGLYKGYRVTWDNYISPAKSDFRVKPYAMLGIGFSTSRLGVRVKADENVIEQKTKANTELIFKTGAGLEFDLVPDRISLNIGYEGIFGTKNPKVEELKLPKQKIHNTQLGLLFKF